MKVCIKIWFIFLSLALIMACTGLIVNFSMQRRNNENISVQLSAQFASVVSALQSQLSDVDRQVLTLSVSAQSNLFSLYDPKNNWDLIYEKSEMLQQQLSMLREGHTYIQSAYFLFPSLNRQITNRARYASLEMELYEKLLSSDQGVYVEGDYLYLFSALSISRVNYSNAMVGVKISLSSLLNQYVTNALPQMETKFSFHNQFSLPEAFDVENEFVQLIHRENDLIISAPILLNSSGTFMQLIGVVPSTYFQQFDKVYIMWNIFLMLLIMSELLLSIILLKRIVAKPLQKLLSSFDAVAYGNTKIRIQLNSRDEFADIYQRFNASVEKLDQLLIKEYQSRIAAQQAEIKYLQAQIQPHFLYNSLYQVYRLCRMEGCDEAAKISLLLSSYYEYITHTDNRNGSVTLAEEIEHTRRYLDIQQFRYGNRLQVSFSLKNVDLNILVPKLVLQPIVENSVKYCIEASALAQLTIQLSFSVVSDKTQLLIEDNCQTLSDADIERQNLRLQECGKTGEISGLINVHLRLLLFGCEEGLKLSRSSLGGLCAKMTFPNVK